MISLSALLHSFSAPVTEEHAWAIIYQVTTEKRVLITYFLPGNIQYPTCKDFSEPQICESCTLWVEQRSQKKYLRDRQKSPQMEWNYILGPKIFFFSSKMKIRRKPSLVLGFTAHKLRHGVKVYFRGRATKGKFPLFKSFVIYF